MTGEALTGDELTFWLETAFQNGVEVSMQQSRLVAPEETPYIHKYEAIATLQSLNNTPHPYHFIV